jgi:hypothetical protein
MPTSKLEERVRELERRVAKLRSAMEDRVSIKDWRRTIGMFTGDEGMRERFEEVLRLRKKDRQRARR